MTKRPQTVCTLSNQGRGIESLQTSICRHLPRSNMIRGRKEGQKCPEDVEIGKISKN